jgi:hypothetical protein
LGTVELLDYLSTVIALQCGVSNKFSADRLFADPDKAARKLPELANAAEADRDQRIAIELINLPFLRARGSPEEYRAGLEMAIAKGLADPASLPGLCEIHAGRRGHVCPMARGWQRRFDDPIILLRRPLVCRLSISAAARNQHRHLC